MHNSVMFMSRISPERLFLDLALGKSDAGVTDNLGIALGLDVNTLYELSAEKCVQNHSYDRAIKLFKLAKVILLSKIKMQWHLCQSHQSLKLAMIIHVKVTFTSIATIKEQFDDCLYYLAIILRENQIFCNDTG